MRTGYLIGALVVLLIVLTYLMRRAKFRRVYGGLNLHGVRCVDPNAALPQMKTGDLALFLHDSTRKAALEIPITPFSHSGIIVVRNGVPYVAHMTRVEPDIPKRLGFGGSASTFPMSEWLKVYEGAVFWVPLARPLAPAQVKAIEDASQEAKRYYSLLPEHSVGVPNFHCFEYAVTLWDRAGLVCRDFSHLLDSGEVLAEAVIWKKPLLCDNNLGPLVRLK